MVIVFTSEKRSANEHDILIRLFEAGLETLHLRKPFDDLNALKLWIEGIPQQYRNRIMIHQHHSLCIEFGLKGIHLKERFRNQLGTELNNYIRTYHEASFQVSTSCHDVETVESIGKHEDISYCFLSPVFDSISKSGYRAQEFDVRSLPNRVIALGGIRPENVSAAMQLGYDGVALLGSIWKSKDPTEVFLQVQSKLTTVA